MFVRVLLALALACSLVAPSWGMSAARRMLLVSARQVTVPGAPTGVSATAGNRQATVSFTAPANNGGAPISGYLVTSSPGGFTAFETGTAPLVVGGLTNGVSYTFTVQARNSAGYGPASAPSNSVAPTDPSVAYTALLMHFDGGNGSTTFTEETGNSAIYPHYNTGATTPTITTSTSVFGGASGYFPNSQYACLGSNSAPSTFAGDFTIEGRVKYTNTGSTAQYIYYVQGFGQGLLISGSTGTLRWLTSAVAPLSAGAWHHFAAVKHNTTCTLYVDGVAGGSQACAFTYGGTSPYVGIGGVWNGTICTNGLVGGYLDELRILNGYAAYTSNFTPPTAPFTYP
jgi:hypothetical protein